MTKSEAIQLNIVDTVGEFREQCLLNTTITCSNQILHDNWLITKKLVEIWWMLTSNERKTVANYIIENWQPYFYCSYWRDGQSDCKGGLGDWKGAVCLHNAVIRYLRFANGYKHYDEISHCYFKVNEEEHCYYEEDFGLPIYLSGVVSHGAGYGHAICAFQLEEDVTDFNSWQFFQYSNLNITPSDPQMPCGYGGEYVTLSIKNNIVFSGGCASYSHSWLAKWKINPDCSITPILIEVAKMEVIPKEELKTEIEKLQEVVELHIVGWTLSPEDITLYVSELTTQNLALENTYINDKIVYVKRIK